METAYFDFRRWSRDVAALLQHRMPGSLPNKRLKLRPLLSDGPQPGTLEDPLTAALRCGARRLLAQAIEAEAEAFLAAMKGVHLPDGRARLVRHGLGPERLIQTGIGPIAVRRVKLRDRGAREAGAARIRFTSAILPRWARRKRSLDKLLPILYLQGGSMGDFRS